MMDKIKEFAAMLEAQQKEQRIKDGVGCEANLHNCMVSIIEGNKYTKINVGPSAKYMIDKSGNIYGVKAYGVIHKGHHYGTLDTVKNYYWGGYHARLINEKALA